MKIHITYLKIDDYCMLTEEGEPWHSENVTSFVFKRSRVRVVEITSSQNKDKRLIDICEDQNEGEKVAPSCQRIDTI